MNLLDWNIVTIIITLVNFNNEVIGECPIDVSNYAKWSSSSTWTDQNGVIPDKANITITKPVLLDVKNPKEVFSITIGEPNGILLFSDSIDISMRVHYILIKNKGSLIIGTEKCKHKSNVQITLLGDEGDYSIEGFDEKFIGCDAGGTIEMHGKRKHPWTKLERTVKKIDSESGLIFRHTDDPYKSENTRGLVIHVFNKDTGVTEQNITVKLISMNQRFIDRQINKMKEFLNGIDNGKVVAVAAQNKFMDSGADYSDAFQLINDLTGSTLFSNKKKPAYAAVTIKGNSSLTVEKLTSKLAEVSITLDAEAKMINVKSYIAFNGFVEFESIDTVKAQRKIHLNNDVSSWEPGNKIILTSTAYDWEQTEECKILKCDSCTSKQAKVLCDHGPKYTHFADFCDNVRRLDMRAEVRLLTRNIKIMGETDGVFGGHIKMLQGFKNAHFEGLELTKMGQNTVLGRYPIHFHMCEDVGPSTYTDPSYIRANSIHHTFARATAIHGTHNCTVQFNVVYDTLGHAIFIEDGGEKDNVIEWNLIGGQRKTGLIKSDKCKHWTGFRKVKYIHKAHEMHIVALTFNETKLIVYTAWSRRPTSYWITNPKTYVRNNIAFGSEYNGFMFVYPTIPLKPSHDKNFMQPDEARHTAIYEFDNNAAHSNKFGLFIDHTMNNDSSTSLYNRYDPLQHPLNKSSGPKQVYLTKFTAFKNTLANVWNRGSSMTLQQASVADSEVGLAIQSFRDGRHSQIVEKTIVYGESCNTGEDMTFTLGNRFGLNLDNGPQMIRDVFFDNFTINNEHNGSAIQLHTREGHPTTTHSTAGILFGFDDAENSQSRLFLFLEYPLDGDSSGAFRDLDGSVTGMANSSVVPVQDFLLTADCKKRDHWLVAVCPHNFGEVAKIIKTIIDFLSAYVSSLIVDVYLVGHREPFNEHLRYTASEWITTALLEITPGSANSIIHVARDDYPFPMDISDGSLIELAEQKRRFMVIVGGKYSYTAEYQQTMPSGVTILGNGITRSEWVRVGLCVPRFNATFKIRALNFPKELKNFREFTEVNTIAEVESDANGSSYMYDRNVGVVIMKMISKHERTNSVHDREDCLQHECPQIKVYQLTGDLSDCKCHSRFQTKYFKIISATTATPYPDVLPATASGPPADWGAPIFPPVPDYP